MYILDEKDCPVPIEYVDILRRTETDLDARSERTIRDIWTYENANYDLSQPWTGRVTFELRRIDPGNKWYYVEGRRTQIQKSTRAGHITPEAWQAASSMHPQWIKEWKTEGPKREKERARRGMPAKIPRTEQAKYESIMAHFLKNTE